MNNVRIFDETASPWSINDVNFIISEWRCGRQEHSTHLGPGKNSTASYVKKFLSLTLFMDPGLNWLSRSLGEGRSMSSKAAIVDDDVVVGGCGMSVVELR